MGRARSLTVHASEHRKVPSCTQEGPLFLTICTRQAEARYLMSPIIVKEMNMPYSSKQGPRVNCVSDWDVPGLCNDCRDAF